MVDVPGEVLQRKLANFLVPGATAQPWLPFFAGKATERFSKGLGGLWVGGTVVLTSEVLAFDANALNRSLHEALPELNAPLDQIVEVEDRFGVLTRIVDVRFANGVVVTFRCFGARAFAERIRAAAAQRKAGLPAQG